MPVTGPRRLLAIASAAEWIEAGSFTIDGEELRDLPLLDRKAALSRRCATLRPAPCSMNALPRMGRPSLHPHAGLVSRESSLSGSTAPIDLDGVRTGSRSAIQRASRNSGSAARIGTGDGGWLLALAILALLEQRRCGQRWLAA